jgi:hypothetical protein
MGEYTRIQFQATLRSDLPEAVRRLLRNVVGQAFAEPGPLPDHVFFRAPRWERVFNSTSTFFETPEPAEFLERETICLRFNRSLTNYDDEIEKFCDWIAPHIADPPGTVVGERESEHAHAPTLLVLTEDHRISELLPRPEEHEPSPYEIPMKGQTINHPDPTLPALKRP